MMRREGDLLLVVASSLVLTTIVLAVPSATAARVALGLPFVLFFPGYALIAALFPRKDDLDSIERIALSLGLSIAVVPLIGLALNYSPWGIRLNPILAFLTLFIVLATAAALFRRRMIPADDAFGVTVKVPAPSLSQFGVGDRLLAVGLVLALIGLGLAAFFVATSRGSTERFTEFYALGSGGKAENYPSDATVGEKVAVILGVVNHEGEDAQYRIAVIMDGETAGEVGGIMLADGESWEDDVAAMPAHPGPNQKLEFLLYRGSEGDPYRRLHLFIDVKSAAAAAVRPPQDAPLPAPSPSPAPGPVATVGGPAGFIYLVRPGDSLATISERFGLNPEAIAAANGLNESDSLVPGEELVVPGVIYFVQPGDTVYGIAAAFDVPPDVIIAANDIEDASIINPGQELRIPGGRESPVAHTPETIR